MKPCMRCWAAIVGIAVVVAAKVLGLDGATVDKLANIIGLTVGAFGLEHVVRAARGTDVILQEAHDATKKIVDAANLDGGCCG